MAKFLRVMFTVGNDKNVEKAIKKLSVYVLIMNEDSVIWCFLL